MLSWDFCDEGRVQISFQQAVIVFGQVSHMLAAALASWFAFRVYAVVGALGLLAVCYAVARNQAVDIPKLTFYGRRPTLKKTIERRLKAVRAYRRNASLILLRSASLIFAFGFALPGLLLVVALHYYQWLLPGREALAIAACGRVLAVHPRLLDLSVFVLGQFQMGIAEFAQGLTARHEYVQLSYLPHTNVVALAIIGFRYFVALFATSFARTLVNAARAMFSSSRLDQIEAELLAALERAER